MKQTFLEKYRDYGKTKDMRDEIFRMLQGENEFLEDYEQRFQLNYKRDNNYTLYEESLKLVLPQGVSEGQMEILNLLANEDIFQHDYDDIIELQKLF